MSSDFLLHFHDYREASVQLEFSLPGSGDSGCTGALSAQECKMRGRGMVKATGKYFFYKSIEVEYKSINTNNIATDNISTDNFATDNLQLIIRN